MGKTGSIAGGRRARSGGNKLAEAAKQPPVKVDLAKELASYELDKSKTIPEAPDLFSGDNHWAGEIYTTVYKLLIQLNVDQYVNQYQVTSFAQSFARYMQAEAVLSEEGLLIEKKTGLAESPYVNISLKYLKTATAIWYEINTVIRQFAGLNLGELDDMEKLLRLSED